MNIHIKNKIDYILLLLFLGLAGIPYIMNNQVIKIGLFFILFFIFLKRKNKFNKNFLWFIFILSILTFLQAIKFDYFSFQTNFGLFIMIISAYLMIKIIDKKFTYIYVNIFYYISIISIFFYLILIFIPSIENILFPLSQILKVIIYPSSIFDSILIYNISHIHTFRNSGPFWEPGAFAGYLLLALIFNYLNSKNLINKKNIILVITIISTFSTTVYIALFVFIFSIYFSKINNIIYKTVIVFFLLIVAYFSFTQLDFLGKKILNQYEYAMGSNIKFEKETQRFVNVLKDFNDFNGHELIGRGSNPLTRYDRNHFFEIRTVGITDTLVKFGFPFFILLLYLIYKSIKLYIQSKDRESSKLMIFGIFISILIPLSSEIYFNFTMYWSLVFLHIIYKKEKGVIFES